MVEAEEGQAAAAPSSGWQAAPAPADCLALAHAKFIYRVPREGFLFAPSHCWLLGGAEGARLGLSDFLQQNLGDLLFCTPVPVGTTVEQGGTIATLESNKTTLELPAPVAGRVVSLNEATVAMPELINEDPYGRGWLVEIVPEDWAAAGALLDGPSYAEQLRAWLADPRAGAEPQGC